MCPIYVPVSHTPHRPSQNGFEKKFPLRYSWKTCVRVVVDHIDIVSAKLFSTLTQCPQSSYPLGLGVSIVTVSTVSVEEKH